MRIDNEPKLNFEDVLLKPKRSTLSSRRDVDMTRKFTFRNSGKVQEFLPIFASNMDGVGTFSMAKEMQKHKMMTVITKSTTVDQWRTCQHHPCCWRILEGTPVPCLSYGK